MKRFIVAAILVGALAALVGGTALAAGPVTPPGQGLGPAAGVQDSRAWPCGAAGAGGMMGRGAPTWAGEQDAVAELLDMTQEEVQAERLAGKSLAQIAVEQGVSEQDLIDAMLSAKKDALAELVAGGKLSQAQADLMIQNMADRVKTMVERTDVGPASGRGGARGMMGQGAGQGMRGGRWNRS
jgi:hypothetical protein